ncbi:MAG: hypothetical protein DIZ80_05425 [endosymbiont of Galathealinum brachiosum]|uniref:Uracil-DNA glycosylase-like domain-containing protein n=1 Tax=endosymbiont of Galathealinum brachiosum TaxID=2200906 RepID=A0A370DL66_9GAMM|nr:MAG: hypothetical protein DIZ80_05425 [endosymbiont of Galathealinum brachiosum]
MFVDNVDNIENSSPVTGVLSESLRCQYLNSMGIQTWFDPSLVVPQAETVIKQDEQSEVIQSLNRVDVNSVSAPRSVDSTHVINETKPPSEKTNNGLGVVTSRIEACEMCELHTVRKQAITGQGNVNAELFIVIDAPVKDINDENALLNIENKKMLQAMLQTIGYSLSSIYITSLVKCRPPEQRVPQTSEMICCDDHLSAQIKLVQPDVIMILGELASQQLLVSQKSLTDLRLRHHKHLGVPVYASYHPQELFNSSENKRKVWADLLQISKHLNN